MTIREEISAIEVAVAAETQDTKEINRLVDEFNQHDDYAILVSLVVSPSSGRLEIIPMEK